MSNYSELGLGYLLGRFTEKFMIGWIGMYSRIAFALKCKCWGIRVGDDVKVHGPVHLRAYRNGIVIGNRVQIISSCCRTTAAPVYHPVHMKTLTPSARIIIEDDVAMLGATLTCRSATIHIRQGAMVGANCIILDSDFHIPWPADRRNFYEGTEHDAPVDIGKNVWIGINCMIMKGVTIGDNSIIGAGSVVRQSVPANSVVIGNPAKAIISYPA
jgi:acetyltransferase-like isoleucine patch superfamily enzyme